MALKKKTGRPTKPGKKGERVPLGLRVTASLKEQLDSAALKSGRSQSQEAEFRLERSFQEEAMLGGFERMSFAYAVIRAFERGAFASFDRSDKLSFSEQLTNREAYRDGMIEVYRDFIRDVPQLTAEDKIIVFEHMRSVLLQEISRRDHPEKHGFVDAKPEAKK